MSFPRQDSQKKTALLSIMLVLPRRSTGPSARPEECRTDGQIFLDLLERHGLVHAPTLREELAKAIPYFAPLAGGDLGEYGIRLV